MTHSTLTKRLYEEIKRLEKENAHLLKKLYIWEDLEAKWCPKGMVLEDFLVHNSEMLNEQM